MDAKVLRQVAEDLAVKAGRIQRRAFFGNFDVESKADTSLVTSVDKESEALIKDEIRALFPDHAIIGEEEGEVVGKEYRWVIDPLDGTNNFAKHVPFFNVSIAVEHKGEVIAGAVYNPILDELFSAAKNYGALFNNTLFKAPLPRPEEKQFFGFCHGRSVEIKRRAVRIFAYYKERIADIRKFGSAALEISYVAKGYFDAFIGYGLKLWDFRAAELIAREAGLEAKPLNYNDEPFILVAHPSIYTEVYEKVMELLESS